MRGKWGAVTALACLVVSACGGNDNGPTAESVASSAKAVDDVETTPVSTLVPFGLPSVDDGTAAATLQALEEADLVGWIERAQGAVDASGPPCDPFAIMLTSTQFDAVVALADEVTGELLANLDASLGAAAEWCRRNDVVAAQAELDDAKTTAAILAQRLEELDR
jgi:hypothetical protein